MCVSLCHYSKENNMVLVGRPAPDFTAAAVLGNGEIIDSFNLQNQQMRPKLLKHQKPMQVKKWSLV